MSDALPVDEVLPQLTAAVRAHGRAVLQAPPGAGKTSRVPLALRDVIPGRIVMLEPRRLAARAAAERLASQLGEAPGGQVGYRMRGDSVPGSRIEVVTEGILTRMIQSDADLPGIGALIFDEFHERSLQADLGLALAWEVRQALRPDLAIVVMSATLDAAPVASLLDDAPVITSQGRAFDVDIRWLDRPQGKVPLVPAATALVQEAVRTTSGGVLVFLPGAGEIERVAAALRPTLPDDCVIRPLYGAMEFAAQRAAIRPAPTGRKIVLATAIAETSLTIEDVRVVVDAGRARRARFDPRTGMSQLVTEPVSRAEAAQRSGRAGRVAPGICFRMWSKPEEGALPAFPPAEIEAADLTGLALDLAEWGAAPGDLAFLTPPPATALAEAQALLTELGVLAGGRLTDHGAAVARLPMHPRLGHMLIRGGKGAAPLAALLAARPAHRGGADVALHLRQPGPQAQEARRFAKLVRHSTDLSVGQMAALAYPDRVGLRRPGDAARYILSGGRGAVLDDADGLAGERLIVACDLDGAGREARVRLAAHLTLAELHEIYGERIAWVDSCVWSRRTSRVETRRQQMFGALVLDDRVWSDAPPDAVAAAMLDGVRQIGLRLTGAAARFRARAALIPDLPDMSDTALMATLEDWLLPHLGGVRSAEDWRNFDLLPALRGMLDWAQQQRLDSEAPAHFTTPLGRRIPIDYAGDTPEITLRIQEMFGTTRHPVVAGRALRVTLLSPGGKPVQTTQDIPAFWVSSYADVRRDMRGRYPRHPWPEDPTQADPTLRAKPRGT